MGEVIFIIGLILGLIVPFLFLTGAGRWFWVGTMSLIGGIIGGSEIISTAVTGMTISRHFWNWSLAHPKTAWIVLGALALGWLNLLVHLAWKLLTKKKA